jgi:hypothetical protein
MEHGAWSIEKKISDCGFKRQESGDRSQNPEFRIKNQKANTFFLLATEFSVSFS